MDTDASPHYPSGYDSPNVISVAATDPNDSLAVFSSNNGSSNYGATSVDLAAPGDHILSTLPGNTYGYYEGTSTAAPHVSGVAALIAAQDPNLDDAGIKAKIFSSVDEKTNLLGKVASGGRLNAARAIGASAFSPNTAPSISTLYPTPSSATRDRTPTIRATVRDDGTELAKSNIRLYVDGKGGADFTYDAGTDRLSFTTSRLRYDRHTVKITATDAAGKTGVRSWSFRVVR